MNLRKTKPIYSYAITLLVFSLCLVTPAMLTHHHAAAAQQPSITELESEFQKAYAAIQHLFANGPASMVFPADPRERRRIWQDDLSANFTRAASLAEQILDLNPPNAEVWREHRDTLLVYGRPAGTPGARTVFGTSEVQKKARLRETPLAVYPETARAAKAGGEVRLRLVLAADGTVKYIFPMKPEKYGLTQAAIESARQIKFEPAIKNGQPVSQFLTLAYEFKNGKSRKPFVPEHEFYF
jgi:TonB family protein